MKITRQLRLDYAENSIMQTITIAVSVILIAVGITTAPGLINNARDNNARSDLANIAYAEEQLFAEKGHYTDIILPGQPESLATGKSVRYSISNTSTNVAAQTCSEPEAFLLRATSPSGKTFYRSSFSPRISDDANEIVIPSCVNPEFILENEDEGGIPIEESPAEMAPVADLELVVPKNSGMNAASQYTHTAAKFPLFSSHVVSADAHTLKDAIDGAGLPATSSSTWAGGFSRAYKLNANEVVAKAYNSSNELIGHSIWASDKINIQVSSNDGGNTGFIEFANFNIELDRWQDFYHFYNGGSIVFDFGGTYIKVIVNKASEAGFGLNHPDSIVNGVGQLDMYWGGIAEGNRVRLKQSSPTYINNVLKSPAAVQRVMPGVANVYFSPTGNDADYEIDAADLNVTIADNQVNWIEGYTYGHPHSYYKETPKGSKARGKWKVVVSDILGDTVVYEGVAPGWTL